MNTATTYSSQAEQNNTGCPTSPNETFPERPAKDQPPAGYDPEQYLPPSPQVWTQRVSALIAELRRPALEPCAGFLYHQENGQPLQACVDGVINEMAIRGGLPAYWVQEEDPNTQELAVYWDISQPYRNGATPFGQNLTDSANVALPEALLYHGLSIGDDPYPGSHHVNILDCDPEFIRQVINDKHGVIMGRDTGARVNDRLLENGANPLLVMADILEHLLERPAAEIWHDQVQAWQQ